MATAEESRKTNIEVMGKALGDQYSALWQELVQLHMVWHEFVVLYGTSSERTELLNRAASNFFYLVQQCLWETTILYVCRLTDPSLSMGKANLKVQNLYALIEDKNLKGKVLGLNDVAILRSDFCRDWRNRHISHRDLDLALKANAAPLKDGTVEKMNSVLAALAEILNAVEAHFYDGRTTGFTFSEPSRGASTLVHLLDEAVTARRDRFDRLIKGASTSS